MNVIQNEQESAAAFRLSPELLFHLGPMGSNAEAAAGYVLFRQGDTCTGVYILKTGTARVSMLDDGGNLITCRDVGQGSILGLPATLCQDPYMFTARATGHCTLGFIDAVRFQEFLRLHPELCMQIVQLMSMELAIVNRKRAQVSRCGHTECSMRAACGKIAPERT